MLADHHSPQSVSPVTCIGSPSSPQEYKSEVSGNHKRKSEESETVIKVPVLRRSERVAVHRYEVTPTQGGS